MQGAYWSTNPALHPACATFKYFIKIKKRDKKNEEARKCDKRAQRENDVEGGHEQEEEGCAEAPLAVALEAGQRTGREARLAYTGGRGHAAAPKASLPRQRRRNQVAVQAAELRTG